MFRSKQALSAFTHSVRKNLPLTLKNTLIAADDFIYILGYANGYQLSKDKKEIVHGAPRQGKTIFMGTLLPRLGDIVAAAW